MAARSPCNVLIEGESGTGKELFARAIHELSPRANMPLIAINCGAIPTELFENELFGHESGAFTGAGASRTGLIAEANQGTLFLDEISCLPRSAQAKLLRLLQEHEYRPLGCTSLRYANVRIIAAANVNLKTLVSRGDFRADLFYRINLVRLTLPPLRERITDVPLLARFFLNNFATIYGRGLVEFTADAMIKLLHYEWPGNVRELSNVIESCVIFTEGHKVTARNITLADLDDKQRNESFKEAKAAAVSSFEVKYIERLLSMTNGNISEASRLAGKHRRAFWELLRKHGIDATGYHDRSLASRL